MQSEKSELIGKIIEKQGCTGVYTFKELKSVVLHLYEQNLSLRDIAREFGPPVNHADIQRILRGIEPRTPTKRLRLCLPALASAPVCAKCGELHVAQRCTNRTPGPKRAHLPQINMPKIKGQPYKVRGVIPAAWVTPLHPDGPPLVIIEREGQ